MKQNLRLISLVLVLCLALSLTLSSCSLVEKFFPSEEPETPDTPPDNPEHVDYVAQTKIDMTSATLKQEVTVKMFIDGDTTHFNNPERNISSNGVVKARYLAVNTPESTGAVEEYGKAASNFTRDTLSNAVSILLESSEAGKWGTDSNGRQLVWVWYKTSADADYRCLNIELLQNGLAAGSSASESSYGKAAVAAIAQATREKLNMFSGEKDPLFYYGDVIPVDVKELRLNPTKYEGKKVAVTGLITKSLSETAFMEQYDEETDTFYGLQVYFSFNASYDALFKAGNITRAVGTFSNFNGTWQLSGIIYDPYMRNDPNYTAVESKNNELYYNEITAEQFNSVVTLEVNGQQKQFWYYDLALSTSVSMKNLEVVDTYTTNNGGDNDGAITLTCRVGSHYVDVRTDVLKDFDGHLVTEDYFIGKTIDVKGIIEFFSYNGNESYQIKVSAFKDITIH